MKLPRKVYLIDTNVVLRYLLGDHPEFSPKAQTFMFDVSKGVKKASRRPRRAAETWIEQAPGRAAHDRSFPSSSTCRC